VAQAAHAENPDLVAGLDAVVLERRVGGDAGAEIGAALARSSLAGMRTTKCSLTTMLSE
jgi:hypothetical protein